MNLSVLIPGYNEEIFLRFCLESIFVATEKWQGNVDVIYSDNNSTDNSIAIAREFEAKFSNFRLLNSEDNYGSRANWAKLIKSCSTEWICFIDAHDALSPDYLEKIQEQIKKFPHESLYFSNEIRINESNLEVIPKIESHKYTFDWRRNKRIWQTILYTSHLTEIHGVMRKSDQLIGILQSGKSWYYDITMFFHLMTKGRVIYASEGAYFRRYRDSIGMDYMHINGAGENQTRLERVLGNSKDNFSNIYNGIDAYNIIKNDLRVMTKTFAKLVLFLKYRNSKLSYFVFRGIRFILIRMFSLKLK